MLQSIALTRNSGTPGWYLHILVPWSAPALGLGIWTIWECRSARPILLDLVIWVALFQFIAVWSQFALYTGCAVKADHKIYHFSTQYFCLDQYSLLISRLGVIGWPLLTLIGFGSGFGGALVLFLTLWRRHARPTISFGEAALRTAADRELDR